MKIAVNLASHPYIELRPVYSRLRTWIVILALVGGALWYLYRSERSQAQIAQADVAQVENHVRALERQQRDYQALMRQPKEAGILEQSEFLNGLFQQKAFSWTATMTDLETVLPSGVQVLSLDPNRLDYNNPRVHRTDHDFAVAWSKMYGKGRVFYSTLGHTEESWSDPDIKKMYFEAIRWALWMTDGSTATHARVSQPESK